MSAKTDAGHYFAEQLGEFLEKKFKYVVTEAAVHGYEEVKVNPFPSGVFDDRTKFTINQKGQSARGDFLVSNDGKNWELFEAKLTKSAPYTTQQKKHYNNINRLGGLVSSFGKRLKGGRPKNSIVKTTRTLYSSDLDAVKNGLRDWDELLESRKNVFAPPEDSPKVNRTKKRSLIPKRFTSESKRGTKKKNNKQISQDRGVSNRGTILDDVIETDKSVKAKPVQSSIINNKDLHRIPNIPEPDFGKTKNLKELAKKTASLRFSLTGNIILELAKALLFGILQGKLNDANQEMLIRFYINDIYEPTIKKSVLEALDLAEQWSKGSKKFHRNKAYIPHSFDVYMEQQQGGDSTFETGVNIGLFFVNDLDFIEVFNKIDAKSLYMHPNTFTLEPYAKEVPFFKTGKRKNTSKVAIVKYNYIFNTLVWDYDVYKSAQSLKLIQSSVIKMLNSPSAAEGKNFRDPVTAGGMESLIEGFEFLDVLEKSEKINPSTSIFGDKFKLKLFRGTNLIEHLDSKYSSQQKALLSMYLGKNPFTERRRKIRKNQKDKEEIERQKASTARLSSHKL